MRTWTRGVCPARTRGRRVRSPARSHPPESSSTRSAPRCCRRRCLLRHLHAARGERLDVVEECLNPSRAIGEQGQPIATWDIATVHPPAPQPRPVISRHIDRHFEIREIEAAVSGLYLLTVNQQRHALGSDERHRLARRRVQPLLGGEPKELGSTREKLAKARQVVEILHAQLFPDIQVVLVAFLENASVTRWFMTWRKIRLKNARYRDPAKAGASAAPTAVPRGFCPAAARRCVREGTDSCPDSTCGSAWSMSQFTAEPSALRTVRSRNCPGP